MQAYDYNNQPKCTQATPEDKQHHHAHKGTSSTQARREPIGVATTPISVPPLHQGILRGTAPSAVPASYPRKGRRENAGPDAYRESPMTSL